MPSIIWLIARALCLLGASFPVAFVDAWSGVIPIMVPSSSFVYSPFARTRTVHAAQRGRDTDLELESPDDDQFHGVYSPLIDDGKGNIRADLATSIYKWENEARQEQHLPKVQYSTRAGLRLVNDMVKNILRISSASSTKNTADRTITTYADLVQEGVVALMCAMATYNATTTDKDTSSDKDNTMNVSFEQYAKRAILESLTQVMAQETRPMKLPPDLLQTVQAAKRKRQALLEATGREPTMAQVVRELQLDDNITIGNQSITAKELEVYQLLASDAQSSTYLSVERTMEIYDPTLEHTATFADQASYEQQQYGSTASVKNDSDGETYSYSQQQKQQQRQQDEAEQQDPDEANQEGEDEMYKNLETVVAPLRDMIVDHDDFDNPSAVLETNELHDEVLELLHAATLNDQELKVISMRFGLDAADGGAASSGGGGVGASAAARSSSTSLSLDEIGTVLGVTVSNAREIERQAMDKLRRASYQANSGILNDFTDEYE